MDHYTGVEIFCYCLSLRTGVASELHPRIMLLEGHDEGGEVNHRLQLVPGFVLGNVNITEVLSDQREIAIMWAFLKHRVLIQS